MIFKGFQPIQILKAKIGFVSKGIQNCDTIYKYLQIFCMFLIRVHSFLGGSYLTYLVAVPQKCKWSFYRVIKKTCLQVFWIKLTFSLHPKGEKRMAWLCLFGSFLVHLLIHCHLLEMFISLVIIDISLWNLKVKF